MENNKSNTLYSWIVVVLLWVVALLNYMDRQMLSTMRSSMMVDIHELEMAENFGKLMAIFLWIYGFMSPLAGLIADRFNRKLLIVISLFVWSGVTFSMGYTNNFKVLFVLRAVMGISEALYIPAGLSLIADYHQGSTRSLAIGIHMTGLYVGQALGGFGATVALIYSWHLAFHFFGIIGMVYSLVLIVFLREYRYRPRITEMKFNNGGLHSIGGSLSLLLGMTSFWIIMFYFAIPSISGWAVKNWMPTLFSSSLRINMSQAGPLATITIAISSLLGVIIGGIFSDRWIRYNLRGRIYTSVIGLSLTIPALLFFGLGQGFLWIVGGAILFGLGYGIFDANNMPILCQFVPPGQRATGYGLMNMMGVFAGALITWLLGKSTDSGHLGRDMTFIAIPVVVAIVLQLMLLRPTTANKLD